MNRTWRIAALIATILIPAGVQAQQTKFGVIGAINLATIAGDNTSNNDSKVGGMIGVFMNRPTSGIWSFQGEAEYTQKGTQSSNGGTTVKLNLDYIEVPLMFRAASRTSDMRPYLELGGAFALRVSCSASGTSGNISISGTCDDSNDLSSFDAGLLGGIGFDLPMTAGVVSLGARYTLGLVDLSDDGNHAHNRNLQFLASIRFK